ncbi:NACHT and WD repeat domain-containing protein 2-like isoform X1 [Corythoichthys intestinalis]|uniref:NACHT and WD repeat domain-containing protein 2-like isoform X1 n=2 Tax=Corythoichthys intestinalis TaxID=161448 RepID=UPI0025A651B8|nr:NACHT and WD repeat domain-containing protein 2-like isoform X1 [Corythoichthys intestinalis]
MDRRRSTCVKLYLCANPADSAVERRALREVVFPKLREHCRHKLGVDFRVIDPHESSHPSHWQCEKTRKDMIRECRESSVGPFLLALIGHDYGSASLPAQVEVSHFHLLLQQIQQAGLSTRELERVYHRDENSVPPSFCLRRSCLSQEENYIENLVKVFQTAVSLCVSKKLLTEAEGLTFNRSVLDVDLRFALENCSRDDINGRCLVYVHKVTNLKDTFPSSAGLRSSPSEKDLFSDLIDNFLQGLIDSCQLEAYIRTTECDPRHGYTTARRHAYAELLSHQVYLDLMRLTDHIKDCREFSSCYLTALAREQVEQEELCDTLSRFYILKRSEMEEIQAYVLQSDHRRPLVLTGGPCAGKSVLLAHCAHQMKSWLHGVDPAVITFFTSFPYLPSPERLLSILSYRILRSYDHSSYSQETCFGIMSGHHQDATEPKDLSHLNLSTMFKAIKNPDISLYERTEHFCSLLSSLPSSKKPLVLILDGMDQLGQNFAIQIIKSLPSPIPATVKIILGISCYQTQLMQVIKIQYPECSAPLGEEQLGSVDLLLGVVDRKQCLEMLMSLLSNSERSVTSGQLALVNQALTSCCLTLYIRLLHFHTSLWCSDAEVSHLPDGVHSFIAALLDHLEHKFSSSVVTRAVSYLNLSKVGLTEAELADLLSRAHANQVTQIDVERLLLDLKDFLIRRTVMGCHVLSWVSRHFGIVVAKTYLDSCEARKEIHSEMADYFMSGWNACLEKSSKDEASMQKIEQQSLWDALCGREAVEMMHHLEESKRVELRYNVLMSWRFQHVLVKAGLLADLVTMLRQEDGSWANHRVCALLASILAFSSCFLQSSPLELLTLMETSLLPYVELFPALRVYVNEMRLERRTRSCRLAVVLSPAPDTVAHLRHLQCDGGPKRRTVSAAGTQLGSLAIVMCDGSAWTWDGSGFGLVRLSPSSEQEIKFVGVKSSQQFVLFRTPCNKLLLCDVTAPEILEEVKASQTLNMLEGFVAFEKQFCVWWKQDNIVGLFDASNRTLTNLQCPSYVTCAVFCSHGSYICCGQEDGTVSIFDIASHSLRCSCSNSNHSAIVSIIICEDEHEMACVEKSGGIKLWNISDKMQTPRLVKEASDGSQFKNMVNTEYLPEFSRLLVCHCNQVTVWDTSEWERYDHFLAPQDQTFVQAVFSQDGHHCLACLEAYTLVLVWRVRTGQCILSLDAKTQPHTLLTTTSDIVCVTDNGCLLVWDAQMVFVAAEAPKMKCGVMDVMVEQTGGWFYTVDGTDTVWSWSLETGLPHANFLHDRPVKRIRLSQDGKTLVTLSDEDIYIWHTDTGQNLLRIGGSGAKDVHITPNCKFGVSICEQGLSRVWKMVHGGVVCSIHLYLSDAQVSPESTFLIGLHGRDLLAASLWSGIISKSFLRAESSENVVAFRTLSQHADFVAVIVASGGVYTWKMSDDTVCRHFQLPGMFYCQPQNFQMTSNGSFALLSIDHEAITLLDVSHVRLCSFKAEGSVIKACMDETGSYIAYISQQTSQESQRCACPQHAHPILNVVQLSDGKRVGRVFLGKDPSTMLVNGQQCVFVGFRDGSVGVYSISGSLTDVEKGRRCRKFRSHLKDCCSYSVPLRWVPLETPNVIWPCSID